MAGTVNDGGDGLGGERVRGLILIPFALLLAFVIVAFVVGAYVLQERAQRDSLDRSAESVRQFMRLQMDKDASLMHAAADMLTGDSALRDAMRRGDRDTLSRRVQPLFAELRDRHRITHLYFTLPNRVNLLRVHNPARNGDLVDRTTLFDVADGGGGAHGVELGTLGTLTLRSVVPWRDQGKPIGYVELGEDLSPLAEDMSRVLGVEVLMLVRKDFLKRDKWEEGARMLGRQDSWDQLASSVAVAQSMQSIPTALGLVLDQGPSARNTVVIGTDAGRKTLQLAFLPLTDVAQRPLGDIVLVRDVTASQQEFYRSMVLIAALAILAAAGVAVLFLAGLGRVERAGARQHVLRRSLDALTEAHETLLAQRQPADLQLLVQETVSLFQRNARRPPVRIEMPEAPVVLPVDAALLRQALFNLLVNAAQLAPDDAPITIGLTPEPPGWTLSVLDQGPDVSPDLAETAAGLGLPVVRRIALLHGGRLTVANRPEGGAAFSLWLPSPAATETEAASTV